MKQTDPRVRVETRVLGPEFDQGLRAALIDALRDLGATDADHFWGVGGSQELETLHCRVDLQSITVQAETFVGIAVTGPVYLLERIAAAVAERTSPMRGHEAGPSDCGGSAPDPLPPRIE